MEARGGLSTAALRMPSHPIASADRRCGLPLAAPSASISGRPSPTGAETVWRGAGQNRDDPDGGPVSVGIESTVIDVGEEPALLRPGGMPAEEIEPSWASL